MSFGDIPEKLKNALAGWRSSLSEQERVMLDRYSGKADATSAEAFLLSAAAAAESEENHRFAATAAEECLNLGMTGIQRFDATETLIEAYIGLKRYDDAKRLCESNLSLFPNVSDEIKTRNGDALPQKIVCRNRYVDILIGIESAYDATFRLLDRFYEMGLISSDDLSLRKQSLKIHRLQRSFDGVYTYAYKE